MRFVFLRLGTVLSLFALIFTATTLFAANYVEGEVIISFKGSLTLDASKQALKHHRLELNKHFRSISQRSGRHIGHVRSKNFTTAQLIAMLQDDPAIELVEPNFLRHAFATVPNDTLFSQLWGLRNTGQTINGSIGTSGADIKFTQAWSLARSSTNQVVVAVIDSGVNYTHPDLVANMWTNPGEPTTNGVDNDGNGYIDDRYGYDFGEGDSDPNTTDEHGTHVAGTIAATGNNLNGVIGVDYLARIMALKVGQDSDPGTFSDSAIIEAIDYCVMMKGRGVNLVAINASWGGGVYSGAMRSAIQSSGNAGIVFCVAAGNEGSNNDITPEYPANYRLANMLVVAATDNNDNLASFSNFGASTVDLSAPGVSILSSVPPGSTPVFALVRDGSSTFSATPLAYSMASTGITAQVYDCGLGNPPEFPPAVNGNIALISRGTLFFSEKVSNAITAGARAAIIYNNVSGNFSGTLGGTSNWIPAVSISQADGLALKASLPSVATVVSTNALYDYLQGTSMATPHVVGAVAFAAMNFPNETAVQRVQRIRSSVDVVSSLQGRVQTGGRLNLQKVVDSDGNGLPDWWEQQYFGTLTGTNPNSDPDKDGESNLSEWLTGTNPSQTSSALRILSVQVTNKDLRITWTTVGGHSYVLQSASSMVGGVANFVDLASISINGTSEGTTNFLHPGAATNHTEFYRVRQ